MNFLSLEYFLTIVKSGSISAAAKELYVSQQTLSEHLIKLERELEVSLIKRTRPVQLTPEGKIFFNGAAEIIEVRDRMVHDIGESSANRRTQIYIGEASFYNPPFMSLLVKRFSKKFPSCEVVVRSMNKKEIHERKNDIDLFFVDMPGDKSLKNIPVTSSDMYAVIARQSLLYEVYGEEWPEIYKELMKTQDLKLLSRLPYIMQQDNNAKGNVTIEKAFESAGFNPKVVFCSERNGLNIEMCINGVGAYFGPRWLCLSSLKLRLDYERDLCVFPIRIPGAPASILGIGYCSNKILSDAECSFIEMTKEYIREIEG